MEQRIEKLERQCRTYRNLFILAGLAVVALVTWGATKPIPEEIRTRRFEVVHENGETVGIFQTWNLGGSLEIYNEKGLEIFDMAETDSGSGLMSIYNSQGNLEFRVTHSYNGGKVNLYNKTEDTVVQLYSDDFGNGVVGAYNRKGKGRTLKPGPQ